MNRHFLFLLFLYSFAADCTGLSLRYTKTPFTLHYYPSAECSYGLSARPQWICCAKTNECVHSPSLRRVAQTALKLRPRDLIKYYGAGVCTGTIDVSYSQFFKIFIEGGLPSSCTTGSIRLNSRYSNDFLIVHTDVSASSKCNTVIDVAYGENFSIYFSSRALCSSDFPTIDTDYSENFYITFHSPHGPTTKGGARGCSATTLSCRYSDNFTVDYVGHCTDCPSQPAIDADYSDNFTINYQAGDNCNAKFKSSRPRTISANYASNFLITYKDNRQISCQDKNVLSVSYCEYFVVIFTITPTLNVSVRSKDAVKYSCLSKSTKSCEHPSQISASYAEFYDLYVKGVCPRDKFVRTTASYSSHFEVHYYLDGSSPPPIPIVDECKTGEHSYICTANQTCTDMIRGYRCSCKEGFHPVSSSICLQTPCPKLETPWIGTVKVIKYSAYIQVALYLCPPGYKLIGRSKRFCTLARWEGTEPLCVPYSLKQVLAVDPLSKR